MIRDQNAALLLDMFWFWCILRKSADQNIRSTSLGRSVMKNEIQPLDKKPYVTPTVTVHGDVEAITLGFNSGERLDAAYPQGTAFPGPILS
jgi:hypothetical protein